MKNIICVLFLVMSTTLVTSENSTKIDDNELGMGILFDMVNIFLGDVIHKTRINESFLNLSAIFVDESFHEEEVDDWRKWLEYLIGFSVCAAIGILFIVVMPIIGLIFCCCRLCGRCGAKMEKSSSKRAKCKRRSYCTILMTLTTIALAGVVCAFICTSLLYKHSQSDNDNGFFEHLYQSLYQIEEFINKTTNDFYNNVNETVQNTSKDILLTVKNSARQAVKELLDGMEINNLLANATKISQDVNNTKDGLLKVGKLLSELSNEISQLKDSLQNISQEIQNVIQCNSSSCDGFTPSQYDTHANFSNLPTLREHADQIAKITDMDKYIYEVNQSLARVYDEINSRVEEANNNTIQPAINTTVSAFDSYLREKEKYLLDKLSNVHEGIDDVNEQVNKYNKKVYYGGIGVCCAYLLIIVLYYLGLLLGMCGEKPGDGAPCCNTGYAANFLMSGVGFTFILSWILMIICVVLFCVGGPVYTEACRYLAGHDPAEIKGFDDLINNAINIKGLYDSPPPNLSVSEIIQNCKENQPLYSALHLDYVINLTTTLDISNLQNKLKNIKLKVENISISRNFNNSLNELAEAKLEKINFTVYSVELSKQLTVGNLSEMATIVENLAHKESDSKRNETLQYNANKLKEINLTSIINKESELNTTLVDLQKSSLSEALGYLVDDLMSAEWTFSSTKDTQINNTIQKLADNITHQISTVVDSIEREVRESFRCQDLSSALFTMSDAVCLQLVEPVNGLWFSFGWCLFFFVPCLIFAVLLAGQYRRTLEDDKEYDDPNYMLYAGPNPDTIPLTSVDRSFGSSAYPRTGMFNSGYRDEHKRATSPDPPPYDAHMHSGIAAYAPPKDQHQRQAAYGDGFRAGNGANSSYSYPY